MSVELAVVPVAGQGTRMLPLTRGIPKELLPVADKPAVQYVAEELERAGIRHMLLVTAAGKSAIEDHFENRDALTQKLSVSGNTELLDGRRTCGNLTCSAVRQPQPLGLGQAILCSRAVVDGRSFVVALGDSILGCRGQGRVVERLIEVFEREVADVVIAFENVSADQVHRYGIADVGRAAEDYFELAGIVEKPHRDHAPSQYAVAARYVFRPGIFDHLAQTTAGAGAEIQLTDAIARWTDQGGRVLGVLTADDEQRYDIGGMDSYFRAFVDFVMDHPQHGREFVAYLRGSQAVRS